MPSYALIDSQQLDSNLSNIAAAIRLKGAPTETMSFPNGFVNKINRIPTYADVFYKRLSEIGCNVVTIRPSAFCVNSILTDISFPVCTTIGYSAFASCSYLTAASFPKCTTIGYSAFVRCYSLTTISFPICTSIGSNAFQQCTALTAVFFPVCSTINDYAFEGCLALTTASFPKCTRLNRQALFGCRSLVSLYLMGSSVVKLDDTALAVTPIGGYSTSAGRYGSVFVPASLLASYKSAAIWSYISSRIIGI